MEDTFHKPRSGERHLLVPAVAARFGEVGVSLKDISKRGARFRHDEPIEAGGKSVLQFAGVDTETVEVQALVVWTQPSGADESGRFDSGVKLFGDIDRVEKAIETFQREGRSVPIEECRRSSRFHFLKSHPGELRGCGLVRLEDLSSRGARVECLREITPATRSTLRYSVPDWPFEISVEGEVVWCHLKAIWSGGEKRYHAGLRVTERHELQRAAIGRFVELGLARQETRSLSLKQRIEALAVRERMTLSDPGDRRIIIDAVRRQLGDDGGLRDRWFERARTSAAQLTIRGQAGPIADHLEALAVWEYLDRSVDPSLVALAFGLR